MGIQGVKMLTLIGCLCCVDFINPVIADVWRERERETSSFYWAGVGSTWRRKQNPVSETLFLNTTQDDG
jgi:hypothetical protein